VNYSNGICWIDDCRIPFVDELGIKISGDKKHLQKWKERDGRTQRNIDEIENTPYINTQGRFPANILVSDDMLNDGIVSKAGEYKGDGSKSGGIWTKSTGKPAGVEYGDKGTNSRYYDIDKWFDKILND
jgi:hypothetical protein